MRIDGVRSPIVQDSQPQRLEGEDAVKKALGDAKFEELTGLIRDNFPRSMSDGITSYQLEVVDPNNLKLLLGMGDYTGEKTYGFEGVEIKNGIIGEVISMEKASFDFTPAVEILNVPIVDGTIFEPQRENGLILDGGTSNNSTVVTSSTPSRTAHQLLFDNKLNEISNQSIQSPQPQRLEGEDAVKKALGDAKFEELRGLIRDYFPHSMSHEITSYQLEMVDPDNLKLLLGMGDDTGEKNYGFEGVEIKNGTIGEVISMEKASFDF